MKKPSTKPTLTVIQGTEKPAPSASPLFTQNYPAVTPNTVTLAVMRSVVTDSGSVRQEAVFIYSIAWDVMSFELKDEIEALLTRRLGAAAETPSRPTLLQ